MLQTVIEGDTEGIPQDHAQALPSAQVHDIECGQAFAMKVAGEACAETVGVALDSHGRPQSLQHLGSGVSADSPDV